ncbi:hypothetical protein GCM10025868_16330 [Angustibacter aerolatus]|uniref:Uncharacterized protein n=1 Tax=Angustibacter aerolatus TaxID=1162965 RepID=A0ABQ6JDZ7_9ACTN|nr:hypothetical protein [Angustibacter aerolatus]GMA86383.1 hypothetical protein GCM10025868_16330 [Angustibacter aerolatus]
MEGDAAGLDGLLDPAPAWVRDLDPAVRSALGVAGAGEPPSAVLPVLLDRLGDDRRDPPVTACLKAWALLADAGDDLDVDPPARVRVLRGDGTALVHPRDAVVADDPRWLQRTDLGGLVVAPARGAERLADLLDVRLASEVASGVLTSDGSRTPVPQGVRAVLPGAPTEWTEHDEPAGRRPRRRVVGRRHRSPARRDARRARPGAGLGRRLVGRALDDRRGARRPGVRGAGRRRGRRRLPAQSWAPCAMAALPRPRCR